MPHREPVRSFHWLIAALACLAVLTAAEAFVGATFRFALAEIRDGTAGSWRWLGSVAEVVDAAFTVAIVGACAAAIAVARHLPRRGRWLAGAAVASLVFAFLVRHVGVGWALWAGLSPDAVGRALATTFRIALGGSLLTALVERRIRIPRALVATGGAFGLLAISLAGVSSWYGPASYAAAQAALDASTLLVVYLTSVWFRRSAR